MKQFINKISVPEYDGLEALRSSHLKEFLKSPAHYKWMMDNPKEYRKIHFKNETALTLGSFVHALILEPETVRDTFAVADVKDRRTKEYHAAEARAKEAGQELLLAPEYAQGKAMAEAALADPVFAAFLEASFAEVSAVAQIDGVWVKARADMWIKETKHILDIKTTGEQVYWFPSAVKRFGYDMSAAVYSEVFRANGELPDRYSFVVIEKQPPYGIKIFDLDPAYIESAKARMHEALLRYAASLKGNHWPCYNNRNIPLLTEDRGIVDVGGDENDN